MKWNESKVLHMSGDECGNRLISQDNNKQKILFKGGQIYLCYFRIISRLENSKQKPLLEIIIADNQYCLKTKHHPLINKSKINVEILYPEYPISWNESLQYLSVCFCIVYPSLKSWFYNSVFFVWYLLFK